LRWRVGLFVAGGLLMLIDLGLRLIGYRRLCRLLLASSPTPVSSRLAPAEAQAFGRLVNNAALMLPSITCLRRSLATWWLMRWGGLPAQVCIGVRLGDNLASHSWVEHHGQVINDRPEISKLYPVQFSDELDPSQVIRLT
jgi:hypothetical protein